MYHNQSYVFCTLVDISIYGERWFIQPRDWTLDCSLGLSADEFSAVIVDDKRIQSLVNANPRMTDIVVKESNLQLEK